MRSIHITTAALALVAMTRLEPAVAQAEPASAPASSITLGEARARALERNPALAAAGSAARSAEGEWRPARARPNPPANPFAAFRTGRSTIVCKGTGDDRVAIYLV
jgi:hypothetical protein